MNITKELSLEHVNILKVIDKLEEESEKLEKGKPINKEFILQIIDFIRNYADKYHHAKEEDILFKEFCKNESNLHCNPVEQMLHEHDIGRNYVKGMEKGANENNKKLLIDNAIGYSQLLKEHIYKEDNVMYPMSEEVIGEKEKKSVLKKYEDVEKKYKDKKSKYLKFLKSL